MSAMEKEGKFFNASKNAMGNQAKVLTSLKRQQMFEKKYYSNNVLKCVVFVGLPPHSPQCFWGVCVPLFLVFCSPIPKHICSNLSFRDFVVKIV